MMDAAVRRSLQDDVDSASLEELEAASDIFDRARREAMSILDELTGDRSSEYQNAMFKGLLMNWGDASQIDYSQLPEGLQNGMRLYVEEGYIPSSFLQAVLENDLHAAVSRADHKNSVLLPRIISWVYLQLPAKSWGSWAMVKDWAERKEKERAAKIATSG